jgi:hypothetical protein
VIQAFSTKRPDYRLTHKKTFSHAETAKFAENDVAEGKGQMADPKKRFKQLILNHFCHLPLAACLNEGSDKTPMVFI